MGQLITFYATKNGIGNTMCLANVAVTLSGWGYSVLAVDLEFEEGTLLNFFKSLHALDSIKYSMEGSATLLSSASSRSWQDHVIRITLPRGSVPLDLLPTGTSIGLAPKKAGNSYFEYGSTHVVARLRQEWTTVYDFVLLNGRKGVYDAATVTTFAFVPDVLLLHFRAEQVTIDDVRAVATTANLIRQELPTNSPAIVCIPIFSRVDSSNEIKLYMDWIGRIENEFYPIYSKLLSGHVEPQRFIQVTKIPIIPFYEYGETLTILQENPNDPGELSFAYQNIAALIANNISNIDMLIDERTSYIELARSKQDSVTSVYHVSSNEVEIAFKNCGASVLPSARVFLSYAKEDRETVVKLYDDLKGNGFHPWMDEFDLVPGEDWDRGIRHAIRDSDFFIACLSHRSVSKRGYFQKELKRAVDVFGEFPEGEIYLLPVRLEPCTVPDSLSHLHWVDFFQTNALVKLIQVMKTQLTRRRNGS
jgi:cellulose biosynthesis protein BcsQ